MTGTDKPGVPVVLNGRHFTLRLTFSSMVAFERQTGMSMMTVTTATFVFTVIAGLFWAALGNQVPGLTLEGAAELLQEHIEAGHSLGPVIDAINEALDSSGLLQSMQGNAPGPGATVSANDGKQRSAS